MYLERPDQWEKMAAHLRRAGEFGIDTETYGQPDRTSPQHRARVHCWSVGVLTDTRSPRGYRRAVGRVLPRAALDCRALRDVLADASIAKWAHNAPHDRHALENEGVEVRGLQDSLQWLRVAHPGKPGYGLKEAEFWALGYPARPSFVDVVSYTETVATARRTRHRGCICGAQPCRARATSDWLANDGRWLPHIRVSWSVFTPVPRDVARRYDVTDFNPGAKLEPLTWSGQTLDRWSAWLEYSLADAVRGMELVDWLRNGKPHKLEYPWTSDDN